MNTRISAVCHVPAIMARLGHAKSGLLPRVKACHQDLPPFRRIVFKQQVITQYGVHEPYRIPYAGNRRTNRTGNWTGMYENSNTAPWRLGLQTMRYSTC